MAESPVGVLFLSGAGLPPWMWDDVRARITDRPTYVGPRPPGADASLGDHATAALDAVAADRFVIVAHSAGGMVAAKILELQPERVAGLLGVSCVVPAPGASFVGSMPLPNRVVLGLVMRVLGTRPPEKALRAQAAGLPEPVVDGAGLRLRPGVPALLPRPGAGDGRAGAPWIRLHHPRRRAARGAAALVRPAPGGRAARRAGDGSPADARGPGRAGREDRLLRGQRGRASAAERAEMPSACVAVARSPG